MPRRIQCRRGLSWQITPKAIYVGRGKGARGQWGNPYKVPRDGTREQCVAKFIQRYEHDLAFRARVRQELAGKTLACWCPLDEPCHADVLWR